MGPGVRQGARVVAPSSCAHNEPVPDLDEQVRRVLTLLSVPGGGGEPYGPRLTRAATFRVTSAYAERPWGWVLMVKRGPPFGIPPSFKLPVLGRLPWNSLGTAGAQPVANPRPDRGPKTADVATNHCH